MDVTEKPMALKEIKEERRTEKEGKEESWREGRV